MKIKYVSLLPLSMLLVSGIQAMSPGKKLENARKDLRNCLNSRLYQSTGYGCSSYEKAYENVKKEFLEPYHQLIAKTEEKNCQINSPSIFQILFTTENKRARELEKFEQNTSLIQTTRFFINNFEEYRFVHSKESLEEFSANTLNVLRNNYNYQEYFNRDKKTGDEEAKQTLREFIQQHL